MQVLWELIMFWQLSAALGSQQAVVSKKNTQNKDKEHESEDNIVPFGEFLNHSHSFTGLLKNFHF